MEINRWSLGKTQQSSVEVLLREKMGLTSKLGSRNKERAFWIMKETILQEHWTILRAFEMADDTQVPSASGRIPCSVHWQLVMQRQLCLMVSLSTFHGSTSCFPQAALWIPLALVESCSSSERCKNKRKKKKQQIGNFGIKHSESAF